jgi:hypothetical protein
MADARDTVDDLVAEIDRRLSLAHASLVLSGAGRARRPGEQPGTEPWRRRPRPLW